ncbi:MAG: nuclear transport factor 2 family protein [Acidobacteriota bacterium]
MTDRASLDLVLLRRVLPVLLLSLCVASGAWAHMDGGGGDGDDAAILAAVENGYVRGIHVESDADLVRTHFHPSFVMLISRPDGTVTHLSRDEWVERIEGADPNRERPEIRHEAKVIGAVGDAAVVRLELWRDGVHTFTDFLSLYRQDGDWKIVGKTFHRHGR